jgi:hypothetical protein
VGPSNEPTTEIQWRLTIILLAIMMVGPLGLPQRLLISWTERRSPARKVVCPFAHPCDAEALAAYTSAEIADSKHTQHLVGRLKDARSALPDMHGCWKSMQEFSGERHHGAESQISLEAIELSKKSRVAEAL